MSFLVVLDHQRAMSTRQDHWLGGMRICLFIIRNIHQTVVHEPNEVLHFI